MTPCIVWTGAVNQDGYGIRGRTRKRAHHIAWEKAYGPVPNGMHVLHKCDNPPCINVKHLFLGTQRDNNADRDAKGRQAQGERHGRSKLTEADVRYIRSSDESCATLARLYDVSYHTVWDVLHERTWRQVNINPRKGRTQ